MPALIGLSQLLGGRHRRWADQQGYDPLELRAARARYTPAQLRRLNLPPGELGKHIISMHRIEEKDRENREQRQATREMIRRDREAARQPGFKAVPYTYGQRGSRRGLGEITTGEIVYVATRRIPEGILWKIGRTTQNPVTRVRQFGGELVAYTDEISEARVHRLLADHRVSRRDLPKAIGRDAAPTEWFYGSDEVLAFAYEGQLPGGEKVRMKGHVRSG